MSAPGTPSDEGRLRVLIVEDLPSDAELMVLRLEEEGFLPAWERVQEEPEFLVALGRSPDVILSDWQLPRFSGLRALELAREAAPEIPFVIVSGNIGEEVAVESLHRGADDYVLKDRLGRLGPAVRRAMDASRLRAEQRAAEAQLAFQAEILQSVRDAVVAMDPSGTIVYWNRGAADVFGYRADEVVGRPLTIVTGLDVDAMNHFLAPILAGSDTSGTWQAATKDRGDIFVDARLTPRTSPAGDVIGVLGVARDVTQQQAERLERDRLARAIEESGDAVLVADLDGALVYVNRAFTVMTGYRVDEVLGRNPRILQSGHHSPEFYRAMWQTLTAGGQWVTEFINRRKDGSLYPQLSSISPIHDAVGRIVNYVAVAHDLSRERELEAKALRLQDERRLIAEALAAVEPGSTPESTARAICGRVARLSDVAGVSLARFESDGSAVPLALVGGDGTELPLAGVPGERGSQVRALVAAGPFVEPWEPERGGSWGRLLAPFALRGLAHLPVRYAGGVVGVMTAGATGDDAVERLTNALGTLSEFADLGGVVLGPALLEQSARAARRQRIGRVIEERRFHPLFQPIVELRTAAIQGYEALTRFETGDPPNEVIAEAWEVGLGAELELAILRAAVGEASILPQGSWLNLNVSPQLVVQESDLGVVVQADPGRPIVLEVTEHDQVADYALLRDRIRAMGRDLRLAVDDAGAGQANFGHIVELRADFVKLDISLIRGIDGDIGRQALVVGMRHFARAAGCRLIAEGVETAAEAMTAASLGTELGQGFLFGAPAPASYWAAIGTRSPGGGPTSRPSQ